ncbi:TPA: hypothetical protein ACGW3S_004145, partial [Pseudomonas aeruginosa]
SKVRAFIDFLKTRLGHPDAG